MPCSFKESKSRGVPISSLQNVFLQLDISSVFSLTDILKSADVTTFTTEEYNSNMVLYSVFESFWDNAA